VIRPYLAVPLDWENRKIIHRKNLAEDAPIGRSGDATKISRKSDVEILGIAVHNDFIE
jgi:hypothetical protein